MPSTWRTVRVFISSTFRDMHAERDHLVKVVFPALREQLEPYRVHLVDVDLRWGVTREQAESDRALDVCLHFIDECRPFFVGLLGERYGSVTETIPTDTLTRYGLLRAYQQRSITEFEILYGVLHNPAMRGHAFFYLRDRAALNGVPQPIRESVYAETDPVLIAKLENLKQRIRDSGYPVVDGYPAQWDAEAFDRPTRSHGRLVGLEKFGERIHDDLWKAIKAELQLADSPPATAVDDPQEEEDDFHRRFVESRTRIYVGRSEIHGRLLEHVAGEETKPLLVTGPSGSGKSAILARLAEALTDTRSATGERQIVIPHFVGASPGSTSIRLTLRRLCLALQTEFALESEVPQDVNELVQTFRDFINEVPLDRRAVIIIDAINQFDETDRAHDLWWIPYALPVNVKLVLSCIDEPGRDQPILERTRRHKMIEVTVPPLTDSDRREIIRQVPSLSAKALDDHQIDLLLPNPATSNPLFLLVALEELRGFGSYEQLNDRIAALPRDGDPVTALFTQVIERLEEEFDKATVHDILTLLASARRGLSERELQELLGPAPFDGAGGIGPQPPTPSPQPLSDLFPVLRQLRPYLLKRAGLIDFYHRNLFKAVRGKYLDTRDRQCAEHTRLAEYFHAQDYFLESLEAQRKRALTAPPTPRPINVRKVDELPWQRIEAAKLSEQREGVETLLVDLFFLEAKTEGGMIFDLIADFVAANDLLPPERPQPLTLNLLQEAISREIHFIARHPTVLFQCLWNWGWWYDCPEARAHYELTSESRWEDSALLSSSSRQSLHRLLAKWRTDKSSLTPSFRWVRSRRPPPTPLGTSLVAVLRGHQGSAKCVALSDDGRWLVSGSEDSTIRIWDSTGFQVSCLRGHNKAVTSVAISADGRRVVSGSEDGTVRLWDRETEGCLYCLRGHTGWITSVAFLDGSHCVVSGSVDGTVRVWDTNTGSEVTLLSHQDKWVRSVAASDCASWIAAGVDKVVCLVDNHTTRVSHFFRGHQLDVTSVALSRGGQRIASGSHDKTVRVWDRGAGAEIRCLKGHGAYVYSVAISHDGRYVASGSADGSARVWDVEKGCEVASLPHDRAVSCVAISGDGQLVVSTSIDGAIRLWKPQQNNRPSKLTGHDAELTDLAFSKDGQLIVSASEDCTVRIWDSEKGTEVGCLRGHEGSVSCVALSEDSRYLASGSRDHTARLWDMARQTVLQSFQGHSFGVCAVALSPDGRRVLTGSQDKTLRVWDAQTGAELHCLRTHQDFVT